MSLPIYHFRFSIFVLETIIFKKKGRYIHWQCSQYLELNPTCALVQICYNFVYDICKYLSASDCLSIKSVTCGILQVVKCLCRNSAINFQFRRKHQFLCNHVERVAILLNSITYVYINVRHLKDKDTEIVNLL